MRSSPEYHKNCWKQLVSISHMENELSAGHSPINEDGGNNYYHLKKPDLRCMAETSNITTIMLMVRIITEMVTILTTLNGSFCCRVSP
jgi:hypothetical protein